MDTSYAAWRLARRCPTASSAVTKVRVAELPMPKWVAFLERHPEAQGALRVRGDEADERDHGAHHHAAPARCAGPAARASCASTPSSPDRIPKKELAAYLNLLAGNAVAG